MSLDVDGQPILSQGEFVGIVRELDASDRGSGTLQAWWAGEDLSPEEVLVALDGEARLSVIDPSAHVIIDRGVARLHRAFPQLAT